MTSTDIIRKRLRVDFKIKVGGEAGRFFGPLHQ